MSTTVTALHLTIGDDKSQNFLIEISGTEYQLDAFSLSQALMHPNVLTFQMRKGPKEDSQEPLFNLCSLIIGQEIRLTLETSTIETLSKIDEASHTADLRFHGVITSAHGSRTESEYVVDVEARSFEALLVDNPSCKSFENRALSDIIEDITSDYSDNVNAIIDPTFTDPLPYTVQYNESNYAFIQRLACRFGQWLYNDGEHLVFGNVVKGDTVTLGYPHQDIPSYNVDLQMRHTAFSHLASSYNSYAGQSRAGDDTLEDEVNPLADATLNASRRNMTKTTLQNLHSGGFADVDSRDTILSVSTQAQALGQQSQMLTYTGITYASQLRIGSTLIIRDNFLAKDLVGDISDVEQSAILITEITHSFSQSETYSNHFTGIPASCTNPPYTRSDIYPSAKPCRAKVIDNEDPKHLGRIRVQFDWQAELDSEMITPWLRIAQPHAGSGKGFSFIPEIGEEVMIGFEGGNAERPYVTGTLYNGPENPDGAWLPGDNEVKAIRTRNGHTIEIHDQGQGGYIRIYDNGKNNYILTFSTDQKLISLQSSGNIVLYAKNDIIMQAGHDIKAAAGNDMSLSARKDMQHTAYHDIRERAGNDRSASIGHNDKLSVSSNRFVSVDENMDQKIKGRLQVSATTIREEASDQMALYSKTHQQNASDSMSISAGTRIDIKAAMVKTN
ncbi:MAG: type VI secretion system tip protein VgrG [Bacteroidales bacterium]|nr:type VI secretion system tip protein VgrG [Bacteroidales bacterium]